MEKVCPTCRRTFVRLPGRSVRQFAAQTYCSPTCSGVGRTHSIPRACERCGAPFAVPRNRPTARFCSVACRKNHVTRPCAQCGSPFTEKASHIARRLTCSRRCAALLRAHEGRSPRQGQPKSPAERARVSAGLRRFYADNPGHHPNFRGGPFIQTRGPSWKEQKAKARERDGHRCLACNVDEATLGKRLSVHHVIGYRQFALHEDANDLGNLVSVCQSCHMKIERGSIAAPIPAR